MSTNKVLLLPHFEERELLSVRVIAAAERCAVLFDVRGAVGDGDYVRLALYYYARVLFELVRTARSPRDLPSLIDAICTAGLIPESDLFALAGMSGSLCPTVDDPQAVEANCVLCSTAHREFHLRGDFSRLGSRALIRSVVAVLQAVVQRVAPEMIDLLTTALANMNASYGVTHRYSDAHSLDQVPASAFHAAAFV